MILQSEFLVRYETSVIAHRWVLEGCSHLASLISEGVAQRNTWVGLDSGSLWNHNTSIMLPSEGKFECWKLHPTAVCTVWRLIYWYDCWVCTMIFEKSIRQHKIRFDYWKKRSTDANQLWLSQGQFWVCWLLKYKSNWRESSLAGAKLLCLAKIQVDGWQAHLKWPCDHWGSSLTVGRLTWVLRYECGSLNTYLIRKNPIMNIDFDCWIFKLGAEYWIWLWRSTCRPSERCFARQKAGLIVARLEWRLSIECDRLDSNLIGDSFFDC